MDSQSVYLEKELNSLTKTIESKQHFGGPQVGIIAKLRSLYLLRFSLLISCSYEGQAVVFCTTHIACQYDNPEKQIAQVSILLSRIQQLSKGGLLPIIFGGISRRNLI